MKIGLGLCKIELGTMVAMVARAVNAQQNIHA